MCQVGEECTACWEYVDKVGRAVAQNYLGLCSRHNIFMLHPKKVANKIGKVAKSSEFLVPNLDWVLSLEVKWI